MKLSPEELKALRERVRKERNLHASDARARITVHLGTCGIASGAGSVLEAFANLLKEAGGSDVELVESGCAGLCSREPMVTVELKGHSPVKYVDVDAEGAAEIYREHVLEGRIVEKYALGVGNERLS